MADFILEEQMEKVINKHTKEYLMEVVSSYRNGNYRACVVVLYTTVIFDLLQKIVVLKEIYHDKNAEKILNDIRDKQKRNSKDPEWENSFIESIYEKTKIISAVEKEELLHLKSERNYAAHPIISIDDEKLELKHITKETASDLIRKAFEIVFLRDAILAKNIVDDILCDLNGFYNRVKIDGLKEFLSEKYFRRMTQRRKDDLFKSLWKFVFIIDNADCKKNREANYWGLVYLYRENKNHYIDLIKNDEDYYFNRLNLETIESWSEGDNTDIDIFVVSLFKKTSRIMCLIKFIELAPEMYTVLNEHAKNIVRQSINHMYTKDDVVEKSAYEFVNLNHDLLKEQVKLKSDTMFISDDVSEHFAMIFRMIQNYLKTAHNWINPDDYCVLDKNNLEVIFYQSEYRGHKEEFLIFLIHYCTDAKQYWQASYLFDYLKRYKKYFRENHYYLILSKMNSNSQFYDNHEKNCLLSELEKMYHDSFESDLVNQNEEKYLYDKLYDFKIIGSDCNPDKVLGLIEKRASYYSIWDLSRLVFDLLESNLNLEFLKERAPSDYPNILSVLNDSKNEVEKFNRYFK